MERAARIGVISDTHGLLRPQAARALAGVDLILHAGDVGKPEVLEALARIAPVRAVRGNNDAGDWAERLPPTELVRVGESSVYVVHEIADLDVDPASDGIAAVVSGHSHRPSSERRDGVLYLNPGSAGPRRFKLPVSLALMTVSDASVDAELVKLEV